MVGTATRHFWVKGGVRPVIPTAGVLECSAGRHAGETGPRRGTGLVPAVGAGDQPADGFAAVTDAGGSGSLQDLGARALQPLQVAGCGEPVIVVAQSQLFGLAARDLAVDPIQADSPDVPEGAGPGSVGVKEVEGAGVAEGELEVEPGCVRLVDRLEVDGKRDVAQSAAGGLGDEGGVGLGRFAEIHQGLVPLVGQPVQPGRRGGAPTCELEVNGDEPSDAGRLPRGGRGFGRRGRRSRQARIGLGRRATTEMVARRGRILRLPLHRRSDWRCRGLLADLRGKIERGEMVEHAVAAGLVPLPRRRAGSILCRPGGRHRCRDQRVGQVVTTGPVRPVIGTEGLVTRTGLAPGRRRAAAGSLPRVPGRE